MAMATNQFSLDLFADLSQLYLDSLVWGRYLASEMGILICFAKTRFWSEGVGFLRTGHRYDDLLRGCQRYHAGDIYRDDGNSSSQHQALLGRLEQKYDMRHLLRCKLRMAQSRTLAAEQITWNRTHSALLRSGM